MKRNFYIALFMITLDFACKAQERPIYQAGYYTSGVFAPVKQYYTLYGYPVITFKFREFRDTALYNQAFKKIRAYQWYKKPLPLAENMAYVNPSTQFVRIDALLKRGVNIEALKYYVDTATFERNKYGASVETYLPYQYLYTPFYISKNEITNKEYRQFIHYVRDSIARTLLMNGANKHALDYGNADVAGSPLNWTKPIKWNSDEDDYRLDLQPLYMPCEERFYNRRETDPRKLNYIYYYQTTAGLIKDIVNVYPDTLVWAHDFKSFSGLLEPLVNMYAWHPGYDDNPVVGLSYAQVRAFLHWKTCQMQKELNRLKSKFEVECSLPNELEWELATTSYREANADLYIPSVFHHYDQEYAPDLYYKNNTGFTIDSGKLDKPYSIKERYWMMVQGRATASDTIVEVPVNDYMILAPNPEQKKLDDGYWRSLTTTYSTKKSNTQLRGCILGATDNVSEWMSENYFAGKDSSVCFPYRGSFYPALNLYLRLMREYKATQAQLYVKSIETRVAKFNSSCKLVRGGNWYDKGDSENGDMKKTFAPSDSAHSTIGFRYVVRFREKETTRK